MDVQEASPLKELPTREHKLKRNKDRRDSPTLPPARLRLKSSISPSHELDMDKSCSDRSMSSSPDSTGFHPSSTSAFTCYNKSNPSSEPLPVVVTEASSSFTDLCHQVGVKIEDYKTDFDQPLDMTTKRVTTAQTQVVQQQRPSVIMCASALLQAKCNLNNKAHCSNATEDLIKSTEVTSSRSQRSNVTNIPCLNSHGSLDHDISQFQETVSGSCDPVIDEHFRRSLGKDYQQIFSKSSSNSVSITVDDHFAKALGDTWLQLQQPKSENHQEQAEILHSKQQSQFLQHSPEIVST